MCVFLSGNGNSILKQQRIWKTRQITDSLDLYGRYFKACELPKIEARALGFLIDISANYTKIEKYNSQMHSDLSSQIRIQICRPLCAIDFPSHSQTVNKQKVHRQNIYFNNNMLGNWIDGN